MNEQPEALEVVRLWVDAAEEDLMVAEHLLTSSTLRPFRSIGFHAQQCTEKYIKALLAAHNVSFPKIHDLVRLTEMLPPQLKMRFEQRKLAILNRYAATMRYPDTSDAVTRKEAEQTVAIAREVREAVRAHLPREALNPNDS